MDCCFIQCVLNSRYWQDETKPSKCRNVSKNAMEKISFSIGATEPLGWSGEVFLESRLAEKGIH